MIGQSCKSKVENNGGQASGHQQGKVTTGSRWLGGQDSVLVPLDLAEIILPLDSTHSAIIASNPTELSLHAYVTGSPTKLTGSIRAVNMFNSF